MNNWSEGYFTESTYTYGYYRELSPNFMRLCLLLKGIAAPEITEDSCHCELGYGQGLSANIHAAATPGKFFGTDFNPAHAAQANEFLSASGADAKFFEDSFEDFPSARICRNSIQSASTAFGLGSARKIVGTCWRSRGGI